jgi:polysaccharide biosynthesis protein PelA
MRRRDQTAHTSDLVFTTPQGGFVHPTYVNYNDIDLDKTHWRINPFRFFDEAFGIAGWPRPDTTTINGHRIFYAHIDGDGVVNESHLAKKTYSGDVINTEILQGYPTLPTTISLITGYLEMREFQSDRVMNMYRTMLSLPNTDLASHGHAHPLVWKKKVLALDVPGYDYSDQEEIVGSVQRMRNLAKQFDIAKAVPLFLWTGDCRPTEDQIAIAKTAGFLNMNGGDSRFDGRFDSYSFLYPLSIVRGDYRQIYSSAPNENIYTNEWEGPYYGFRRIVETFKNTESPIRIKPANIYYHFYSGEVMAALVAVKKAYDYAATHEVFPLFASEYPPIVSDFFATTITPLSGGGFEILNNGALKTIRYDHESRNVDLGRSVGILGFRHYQGSLYVALDDRRRHEIYLTTTPPRAPHVMRATFRVTEFSGTASRLTFLKRGWHQSQMTLGGMIPKQLYWVHLGEERLQFTSTDDGELTIAFPQAENGGAARHVLVARHYL